MRISWFIYCLFLLSQASLASEIRDKGVLSLGHSHSCAIDNTGVVCWGKNNMGQTDVPSLSNATQVSSGDNHSCALDDSGVVCWGTNSLDQINVPALSNPTQVSSNGQHSCAIDDTGVVCWGSNNHGQIDVPILSNPTQVSLGYYHTCAIDDTGLVCWGRNNHGQIDIPNLTNPKQVSLGYYHTCVINGNSVRCWGLNNYRQSNKPAYRTWKNPSQVSLNSYGSCAIDDWGVVCWGLNNFSQTTVPSLSNPAQVSMGFTHICALDINGVACWGNNDHGQTNVPYLDFSSNESNLSGPTVFNEPPVLEIEAAISVVENNTEVGQVFAYDADGDDISFELVGGADKDLFVISDSGVISFKVAPDFEAPADADGDNFYELSVQASDGEDDSDVKSTTIEVVDAIEGRAIDGPLSGSSVFMDLNGDSIQGDNEPSATSDTDGDGILDLVDTDDDNDNVEDSLDAFPLDDSESVDTDGDGIGNNADTDDDGDTVPDNNDAFPFDALESVDTDGDGIGNNADLDDDGDSLSDEMEIKQGINPLVPNLDIDNDGIANELDTDNDNDGTGDAFDAMPLNATEQLDHDNDGVGNNADTDDDGDGINDALDLFPLNAFESADSDSDGVGDNADFFPNSAEYSLDSDLDQMPDAWERKYGLNPTDASDALLDQDNDGLTALEEYESGTIPLKILDIDANGSFDALTDGLIIMRYAFGVRGESLVSNATAGNAMRTDVADVEAYIESLIR